MSIIVRYVVLGLRLLPTRYLPSQTHILFIFNIGVSLEILHYTYTLVFFLCDSRFSCSVPVSLSWNAFLLIIVFYATYFNSQWNLTFASV